MSMGETLLNFFISPAAADPAMVAPPPNGGGMSLFIMLGIFVLFMYFAMWRPQSKRAKDQRDLINSLAKGDEVVTAGGILGKIAKVNEQYIVLNVSDTVELTVQKSSVANVLPKGTMKSLGNGSTTKPIQN